MSSLGQCSGFQVVDACILCALCAGDHCAFQVSIAFDADIKAAVAGEQAALLTRGVRRWVQESPKNKVSTALQPGLLIFTHLIFITKTDVDRRFHTYTLFFACILLLQLLGESAYFHSCIQSNHEHFHLN